MALALFSCRKVTRLVSQSLDEKMTIKTKIIIRFHLAICVHCRRFNKQVTMLREAFRKKIALDDDSIILSREAKVRIKKKMREQIP